MDYRTKSYGRNEEVADIYRLFENGLDLVNSGPRRLGKTFLLDRVRDEASARGWTAAKVDVAGRREVRDVYRDLALEIDAQLRIDVQVYNLLRQRMSQLVAPRAEPSGPWHQSLTRLDHATYFERLVEVLHGDDRTRWIILIDELPIFLRTLHDKGDDGRGAARDFMNAFNTTRAKFPNVRWMITGSIGLEPLARKGQYLGALVKLTPYVLEPLTRLQATDFVLDLARAGRLRHRDAVTETEAACLVDAVGWRAAQYLDMAAQQLSGEPDADPTGARENVEAAIGRLLEPANAVLFTTWEEHLRKHYVEPERSLAFGMLGALARVPGGAKMSALLAAIGQPRLDPNALRALASRLQDEGYLSIGSLDAEDLELVFRDPLLRRWWVRAMPG